MPTATFNKINDWVEYEKEAANLETDQFAVALSNVAPASEGSPPNQDGNGVIANVTEISYTNLSSRNLTKTSSGQTGGTFALKFSQLVLTASGGNVGPFRYVYVFDDTVAGDPLVSYYDYGESITINDGENLTINPHTDGLYTDS